MSGTQFNDRLRGTAAADTIDGLEGDDFIQGLGGNDLLFGNKGRDTLSGDLGADTLEGGGGFDLVDYTGSAGAVTVTLYPLVVGLGAGGVQDRGLGRLGQNVRRDNPLPFQKRSVHGGVRIEGQSRATREVIAPGD